jgi:LmbE family N-acetylglucosaminyl deacetylase
MKNKELKIIAIGAHIDDIEIACGGTLAKAADRGHLVKMIVLSKSAYAHYDGQVRRDEKTAVDEGKKAASILGIEDLEVGDFPTKDIPNDSGVVEFLNSRLDEFQPDLILTHWPFDTHKSHQNTSLATVAAARYHNSIIMFEPFPPGGRSYMAFRPQLYVDITEFIDRKLDALKAHESEYNKYGKHKWLEAIKARARFRGFDLISRADSEEKYAESFEIVRLSNDHFI